MKYLLDTCVISDFIKGEAGTLKKFKMTAPSELNISTVTVMELRYGLALKPERAKTLTPIIQEILENISVLDFNQASAEFAGKTRAALKQSGSLIGSYDVLLAGAALSQNLILVTANTKEFQRVSGLRLENWRLLV